MGLAHTGLRRWVEASTPTAMSNGRMLSFEELGRLRREDVTLRMQPDILNKATTFFAKESPRWTPKTGQ